MTGLTELRELVVRGPWPLESMDALRRLPMLAISYRQHVTPLVRPARCSGDSRLPRVLIAVLSLLAGL